MRTRLLGIVAAVVFGAAVGAAEQAPPPEAPAGCLACHQGIEPIREEGSNMLRQIMAVGKERGDPAGCVVCHGGDVTATEKEAAHQSEAFYPDPGSPWINEHTCGSSGCHEDHVRVQWHSLMMTEAGKIQGVCWAFGSLHLEHGAESGYEHLWGNYDLKNPDDPSQRLGTKAYRTYMQRLKKLEPQVFRDELVALPDAPVDLAALAEHPEQAAFTYLRNQCLRCHHAVKGRYRRGDYRAMGCSSCHVPYSNEGLYEGDDKSISRDEPGHSLVHSIQATREAKVTVHGTQYSGIPVETCTTCHDRGKRIGVSFQGLMEIPYHSPYTAGGEGQPALHTKHYLAMHQDVHYQKGMTCQDCHTSIDVHSDGCIAAANLGAVQIECADCHGTPQAFPWELPLGYGDEFGGPRPASGPARGTTKTMTLHVAQGTKYPPQDGYLLTARGNPFSNVVRHGDKVTVHTAAGKDIELIPLKAIVAEEESEEGISLAGRIAMDTIRPHVSKMECYTCHASWSPQCYGCHVKIDYSEGKTCFDWLGAGHRHKQPDCAADRGEQAYQSVSTIPGAVHEERSFTRWENPAMGVNGEGRVTPIAPGCQPSVTVVGPDGKAILLNHIFRTPSGDEGSGPEGQLALDVSPTQPHTMTVEARSCESCHSSQKALGHGVAAGKATRRPDREVVVDLETVDGHILARSAVTQLEPIAGLVADWSRVVTEDGQQLQTVGHHFSGSRPLNDEERAHIDRQGVCLACHQEIPDRSLAVNLLHHVAEYTGQIPITHPDHNSLIHKIMLLAAWIQVGGAVGVPLVGLVGVVWLIRRRRRKRAAADAERAGREENQTG
ncbi:MAG: multiheme c-type cytochrome [Planctomycetota bacterium]|jgi:hypothetical protein